MPLIRYERPSSNGEDFQNPQVVPLRKMWYLGVLARVSSIYMKRNPATGKEEQQVTVTFLVTHGNGVRDYETLPAITEAVGFMVPKQFYNMRTGIASAMTTLWRALLNIDFEDVVGMADEDLDFDKAIGIPAIFEAAVLEKPNPKNGLFTNRINIKSFMPVDERGRTLAQQFMKKAEMAPNKNGAMMLVKPRPAELPAGQTVEEYLRRPPAVTGNGKAIETSVDLDEVPF